MKNSLGYLVSQLLRHNNISIDKKELQFQIESHPSYPSLHAITGVLDHFNIDNLALDIPKSEETLAQLPKTFLAQIDTEEGKEFVIAINKGINYQLIYSSKNKTTVSIKEFLKQFSGIIVGVEKTEFTEEAKQTNLFLNKGLISLSLIALLSLFFVTKPSITSTLFLITNLLGLIISIAIKKQEQGQNTVLGNAFCSGEAKKNNCNAVLMSKGATLFKNYKLSDLSIIYFVGLILSTLSLTLLNQSFTLPFLISLLVIPLTLYSIYYQAYIIKKWCLLCLSIVGLLWVQAMFPLVDVKMLNLNLVTGISIIIVASSFLIILTIYSQLSPRFKELSALKKIKIDFYKFKRNFTLFNSLLQKSKSIRTELNQNLQGIVLGNTKSKLNVTIITIPFCVHCKPIHSLVENIYKKHADKVTLQILFNANPKDEESKNTKVVTRLLELYQINGIESCINAMHKIYENQDDKSWLKEFGECSDLDYYCNIQEKQYTWCVDNNINFTPEILINGKSYPNEYDRSDLIFFIEELHEACCIDTASLQLTI